MLCPCWLNKTDENAHSHSLAILILWKSNQKIWTRHTSLDWRGDADLYLEIQMELNTIIIILPMLFEKRTFWHVCIPKTQFSLRIYAVWSEICCPREETLYSRLSKMRLVRIPIRPRMQRFIWIFASRPCPKVRFLTLRLIKANADDATSPPVDPKKSKNRTFIHWQRCFTTNGSEESNKIIQVFIYYAVHSLTDPKNTTKSYNCLKAMLLHHQRVQRIQLIMQLFIDDVAHLWIQIII